MPRVVKIKIDDRYKKGGDPLDLKQWRVILNQTINMTGAELSTMVEKAADKQFPPMTVLVIPQIL